MALIEIQKRCTDCDRTNDALAQLRREFRDLQHEHAQQMQDVTRSVEQFRLDYEGLYQKVRTNLSNLGRRSEALEAKAEAKAEENPDQLSIWRKALVERKLGRRSG